ncbi:flagella synthesis protein FlgN [Castellaniella sp. S9]|uniref:flagella synthesis protein FlgN n=1 Tax=Castellaniella sp. S9 TaxID=2993652 RepID=UPI0022B338BE|nr:flagellar protein FlgN [Castellaniella sp. S9]
MSTEAEALLHCIDRQSALVREFIQTLEDESALLLDSTPNETLEALTARKNDYAQRLGELDRERAERLARLGFGSDRDGVEAAVFAHPVLREPFDALFELAAQASELNGRNGQILDMFIASNRRALDTLRALMGEDLYDAKGRLSRP